MRGLSLVFRSKALIASTELIIKICFRCQFFHCSCMPAQNETIRRKKCYLISQIELNPFFPVKKSRPFHELLMLVCCLALVDVSKACLLRSFKLSRADFTMTLLFILTHCKQLHVVLRSICLKRARWQPKKYINYK